MKSAQQIKKEAAARFWKKKRKRALMARAAAEGGAAVDNSTTASSASTQHARKRENTASKGDRLKRARMQKKPTAAQGKGEHDGIASTLDGSDAAGRRNPKKRKTSSTTAPVFASSNWQALQAKIRKLDKEGGKATKARATAGGRRNKSKNEGQRRLLTLSAALASRERATIAAERAALSAKHTGLAGAPQSSMPAQQSVTAALGAVCRVCASTIPKVHVKTALVALDCEMVGTGPQGRQDALARVSVVNAHGCVLYDRYVMVDEPVTDYREWVSGINSDMLTPEAGAVSFEDAQREVASILKNATIVGHSLKHDLRALLLTHPSSALRDLAKFDTLKSATGKPRKLADLCRELLGQVIQAEEHSSLIDARASLGIYLLFAKEWERQYAHGHASHV